MSRHGKTNGSVDSLELGIMLQKGFGVNLFLLDAERRGRHSQTEFGNEKLFHTPNLTGFGNLSGFFQVIFLNIYIWLYPCLYQIFVVIFAIG
jgi:hypothetical protein